MKKILYIILGMVAILGTACTKFLTEEPKTFLSPDTYYASESQMQDAINGLYPPVVSAFMDGLVAPNHTNFIMLETLTGYHKRTHAYDSRMLGYTLPLGDDNGLLDNSWNNLYSAISRANYAIAGISNSTANVPEETKNALLGEAYFIRAYAYFFLVQCYGPIPVPTEPAKAKSDIVTELTPISGVYDRILEDLGQAENMLTVWNPGNGHVGRGAAKALLAEVTRIKVTSPGGSSKVLSRLLAAGSFIRSTSSMRSTIFFSDASHQSKIRSDRSPSVIQSLSC